MPIAQVTNYYLAPPSGTVTLLQSLKILYQYIFNLASYFWKLGLFPVCFQRLSIKDKNTSLDGLIGEMGRESGFLLINFQFLVFARLAT